jgi:transposase
MEKKQEKNMPHFYSYDLRKDGGRRKNQVSKIFKISRNTINLWLKRRNWR